MKMGSETSDSWSVYLVRTERSEQAAIIWKSWSEGGGRPHSGLSHFGTEREAIPGQFGEGLRSKTHEALGPMDVPNPHDERSKATAGGENSLTQRARLLSAPSPFIRLHFR